MNVTINKKTSIAYLIGLMFSTSPAWALDRTPDVACAADEHPCLRGNTLQDALMVGRNGANPPDSERQEIVPEGMSRSDVVRMLKQPAPAAVPALQTKIESTGRSDTSRSRFESGKAELAAEDKAQLDQLMADVRPQANLRFQVIGHTDNQALSAHARSIYHDNQGLSEARALLIAHYLQTQLGLNIDRFSVAGKGEREPLTSNATPAGMAQNRRVEIKVWYDVVAPVPTPVEAPRPDGVD